MFISYYYVIFTGFCWLWRHSCVQFIRQAWNRHKSRSFFHVAIWICEFRFAIKSDSKLLFEVVSTKLNKHCWIKLLARLKVNSTHFSLKDFLVLSSSPLPSFWVIEEELEKTCMFSIDFYYRVYSRNFRITCKKTNEEDFLNNWGNLSRLNWGAKV